MIQSTLQQNFRLIEKRTPSPNLTTTSTIIFVDGLQGQHRRSCGGEVIQSTIGNRYPHYDNSCRFNLHSMRVLQHKGLEISRTDVEYHEPLFSRDFVAGLSLRFRLQRFPRGFGFVLGKRDCQIPCQ